MSARVLNRSVPSSNGSAHRRRRHFWLLLITLVIAAMVSVVVSLAFGSENLPLADVSAVVVDRLSGKEIVGPTATIVWELRMPRALLAAVVGAGLAIAGAGMQTLVRNPLADPYLLGISAGASVGATAVITFGILPALGVYALSGGALLGALGAAALVYAVTAAQGGLTPIRLVLSGVVMASALSAVASFMVFLSDDGRAANSVMFWMLGSVSGASWERLVPATIVVMLAAAAMLTINTWLDALASGPDMAASVGVDVAALRRWLFAGLGILVGVIVAVSGGIGFVGLIAPHAARLVIGARHKLMLPVAAAGGALFMIWVDVLARMAARPQEIPLGVVTGVIGAPLFLALMGRRNYHFGGGS